MSGTSKGEPRPRRRRFHPMTSAKKHHFVPQFLLKHFARAGTSQVHVFDKLTDKVFVANVADVAAEHRLYEFTVGEFTATIEPSLAEFESKAAAVLRGVMTRDRLTGLTVYDRLVLSALVAQLMLRSTHQRASMRHMIEQARRHIAEEGTDPDSVPQLKTLDKNEEKEVNARILSNVTQQFMPIIADKVWVLHEAPASEILYISDNPVAMHNRNEFGLRGNLGLAVTGVEAYLPLSTSRCLALYCPTTCAELKRAHDHLTAKRGSHQTESVEPHSAERLVDAFHSGAISPLGTESVKFVNSLQVCNAERYLLSAVDGFDLARTMIDQHPRSGPAAAPRSRETREPSITIRVPAGLVPKTTANVQPVLRTPDRQLPVQSPASTGSSTSRVSQPGTSSSGAAEPSSSPPSPSRKSGVEAPSRRSWSSTKDVA